MSSILIKPPQIRSTAASLRNHAKAIQSAFNAIDQIITELSPARFEGLSSVHIRMRYAQKRESMHTAALKVIFFAENLEKIAEKFEEADKALGNNRLNGSVLGVFSTLIASDKAWKLGEGSYANRIKNMINEAYSPKISALEADLEHFKRSKNGLESIKQSSLDLLKELDEIAIDYENHDNLFDYLKDKYGELIGLPNKYEEIRQSVLDRINDIDNKIQEIDSNIVTTNEQLASINEEKAEAIAIALKEPNDTYPVPPANENPTPIKDHCLAYVSDFRGQPPTPGGIERSAHASDLVTSEKYADLRYKVPASTTDLRDQVVPGTVVAWDRGQQGANAQSGHAAVITEVGQDYVIVKESAWGGNVGAERRIPINKLAELTLIGYDEVPHS